MDFDFVAAEEPRSRVYALLTRLQKRALMRAAERECRCRSGAPWPWCPRHGWK